MFRYLVPMALLAAPVAHVAAQTYTPQEIVAGHAAAYQAKNLNAFLQFYASNAEVHLDGMVFRGHAQIRAAYQLNFAPGAPKTQVVERYVDGNTVTDIEQIIMPDGEVFCCQSATYTVSGNKIVKVVLSTA